MVGAGAAARRDRVVVVGRVVEEVDCAFALPSADEVSPTADAAGASAGASRVSAARSTSPLAVSSALRASGSDAPVASMIERSSRVGDAACV
jgi:hypothetical protein